MQKEIWKDIPGYEGMYQVSNLGNVKSLSREMYNGKAVYLSKERFLKNILLKDGYYIVSINSKPKRVHQLVAMAFLNHKPCGYKLVVDHIDNNPSNNNINNLQIITHRENCSKDKIKGTSKYIGVSWSKSSKKWIVNIAFKGKINYLGLFNTEQEASEKYNDFLKNNIL